MSKGVGEAERGWGRRQIKVRFHKVKSQKFQIRDSPSLNLVLQGSSAVQILPLSLSHLEANEQHVRIPAPISHWLRVTRGGVNSQSLLTPSSCPRAGCWRVAGVTITANAHRSQGRGTQKYCKGSQGARLGQYWLHLLIDCIPRQKGSPRADTSSSCLLLYP